MQPLMCGLTWPVLSAPSTCPSCRHLDQVELGDDAGMEALMQEDRWLLLPSCFFQLDFHLAFDDPFSRHVVRRCV